MLMDARRTALDLGQATPCGPRETSASAPRLHKIQAMSTHSFVPDAEQIVRLARTPVPLVRGGEPEKPSPSSDSGSR